MKRASNCFSTTSGKLLGVFFIFHLLLLGSCERKADEVITTVPAVELQEKAESAGATASGSALDSPSKTKGDSAVASVSSDGYTFVAYNLKNYLEMWRFAGGGRRMAGKPAVEVEQLIEVIVTSQPDVLGLCEIGTMDDLRSLQQLLLDAGLDLPHSYLASGEDPVRKLAILSKYPLSANPKPEMGFEIDGEGYAVQRGIADAYVEIPSGKVRLLGVHFKSKREAESFSQETMRRHEALMLRKHLTKIHDDPNSSNDRVLVYGDFNDTTRSTAMKTVIGSSKSRAHCKPIELKDKYGLNWTHHWAWQDVYSRFDFVLANKKMLSSITLEHCYVFDTTSFPKASDHRPLVVKFK